LFIILKVCTVIKISPKLFWPCRYGGEGRYPDTSLKHRAANGAAEVLPVQRPNDGAHKFFAKKGTMCVVPAENFWTNVHLQLQ